MRLRRFRGSLQERFFSISDRPIDLVGNEASSRRRKRCHLRRQPPKIAISRRRQLCLFSRRLEINNRSRTPRACPQVAGVIRMVVVLEALILFCMLERRGRKGPANEKNHFIGSKRGSVAAGSKNSHPSLSCMFLMNSSERHN